MFALPIVPLPFVTEHTSFAPVGCVATVTAYVAPLATCVENVNEPFAAASASPPLLWRTSPLPVMPETVPPTVNVRVTQLIATVVIAASSTVPAPVVTVQVCAVGGVGFGRDGTLDGGAVGEGVVDWDVPFAVMLVSSVPLLRSTTVLPAARPVTVPPIAYVFVV